MTCIARASNQDFDDLRMMESAAKAAGIKVIAPYMPHDDIAWMTILSVDDVWGKFYEIGDVWSPLHDDGDAMRLAVKLGITTEHSGDRAWAYAIGHDANVDNHYGSDPFAATRRAIVRAAAAIGESMP